MSHKRRADWDDAELGRAQKRQQVATGSWRTSHARSKAHEPRIKHKPHADSGVGKDFHSVPYPLTLLPKKTWQALNNGDAKGGVCSRCGKDRDSTTWQRKLFLVAERLSWDPRATSSQQREQNEVALWAINAELGVFDPAVDDDDVVIGGKHSRENEWYPYLNKVEAEMALRIIEKADVLTEMSWPLWKAQACAALEPAEGTDGVGHNANTSHQGESSAFTRQPLGEISSNSSQSSRVSPKGKEKLSVSSRSSLPAHANHPECTYKTLADFYALLDKVERTSPMGARYLEAYAERLHAEICKDCWFQNMVIDLSEDEDEGDVKLTAEPASLGAKSGPAIDLTDSPPYAQRTPAALDHEVLSSSSTPQAQSRSGAPMPVNQPRGHIGAIHDPQFGDVRSKTPGPPHLEARARVIAEPMHQASVEQLREQLSEWFMQHFAADATAQIDLSDMFRVYNGDYVCWPKLGSGEFLPILMRTFPGSRSKKLDHRTTVVEGVRPESLYAKSEIRSVHSRAALVQQVENPDAFSQWLRTYYENAPDVETPGSVLEETYRLHCNATRGTSQFLLSEFLEDLRKVLPTAQIILSTRVIRNIRLKPVDVSVVQTPRIAAPSSISAPAGTHASTAPTAAQTSTQSSSQRRSHFKNARNAVSQELQQASEWLREQYVVDQTCESKQMDIYSAYLTAFGPEKTRVNFKTLMEQVRRIFSTPSGPCTPCDSLAFKGLKPKQPRPYNIMRCTPPPAQHVHLASKASVVDDRVPIGARAPSPTPVGPQSTCAPAAAQQSTQSSVRQVSHRGTTQDGPWISPQQVTNWLWDHYVVNPAAELKQTDLYGAYCRSFDLLEPRDFDILMKHVAITFSTPWVCCSTCNTMVFKGLKPLGPQPTESRRCTPPPSQQVPSSSKTSAANSGSSANQPVRPLLPRQQAGPSSVSKNTQNSEEATRSISTTKGSRKWLLKHYIADTSGTIRCPATFVQCRNHRIGVKHEPFLDDFGFEPSDSFCELFLAQAYSAVPPKPLTIWLTTNFTTDMQATIGVREIMAHWRSDFDLGTPKFESAKDEVIGEFAKTLKKTFPQAHLERDEQNGRLNKFRGLRLKTAEEKTG
ncbi:hypothetical protein CKM354_000870900 [Cercospora kikuchii]|uniref:Uncharacterized protein n=1 Tax=Cercospora kikuchii TaxID=84275 RepID=A0A9P3CQ79_9PEZI|nr:uncharacterized protein CKM354_000870900 [Cercospora kikuchii]GIZ45547.1 hypothetical protein CKM354_000870900 [Cercospora kikuchii]